jgi:uncharacterized protein YdiU (UPF0061 family)
MVAQWMAAGFVHGVLNTDNMNVTGESFDYGPWRFAPTADPSFTAAYFDQTGLYAFGRQAEAGAWNLAQFGGALSLVAPADALNEALQSYAEHYEAALSGAFFRRLGLVRTGPEDFDFLAGLLKWMTETGAPFEQVVFDWFCGAASAERADKSPVAELYNHENFALLRAQFMDYAPLHAARLEHPYFAQAEPCTMLIEEVEAIWAPIAESDDWSAFDAKLGAIAEMREAYGFDASAYALLPTAP